MVEARVEPAIGASVAIWFYPSSVSSVYCKPKLRWQQKCVPCDFVFRHDLAPGVTGARGIRVDAWAVQRGWC